MTGEDDVHEFFTQRVEHCMDALYGVALRLTRDTDDAEDLVADAVAKAWAAIDSLGERSRFRPWIFRILHNAFVSEYRRKAAQPVLDSYEELSDNDDGGIVTFLNAQSDDFLKWWAQPEAAVYHKLLGEKILSAVDRLPEAFRETIVLVNVEGMGYDEAAEVLGVPPGTVRSRMKRGRTMLQKALWEVARDAGLTVGEPSGETAR